MSSAKYLLAISKISSYREKDQGFTLIEVLVGIILTLIFVAVSMQAFVVATAFKVRSQEISEADKWIKADLDSVGTEAKQLDLTIDSDSDGENDTFDVNFATCVAGSSNAGYANRLETQILASSSNTTNLNSEIGDRPYTLTRTLTPVNIAPYNVLQVEYVVTEDSDSSTVATRQSEIIPDVSLTCPSQSS